MVKMILRLRIVIRQNRNGHQKTFRFAGDRRAFEIEIQQAQVPGQVKELSSVRNPIEAKRKNSHLLFQMCSTWGKFGFSNFF
jgi:hypothetical protein